MKVQTIASKFTAASVTLLVLVASLAQSSVAQTDQGSRGRNGQLDIISALELVFRAQYLGTDPKNSLVQAYLDNPHKKARVFFSAGAVDVCIIGALFDRMEVVVNNLKEGSQLSSGLVFDEKLYDVIRNTKYKVLAWNNVSRKNECPRASSAGEVAAALTDTMERVDSE